MVVEFQIKISGKICINLEMIFVVEYSFGNLKSAM